MILPQIKFLWEAANLVISGGELIMRVKKIIIFTDESFPYGLAATNRIISYGKNFIENGKETEVIGLSRT